MGTGRRLAAVCVVALTALTACGKQGCTTLPVDSGIQVQVPSAIQDLVTTLRVELCQSGRCEAVSFARTGKKADGTPEKGLTVTGDAYDLDLSRLGSGWKAATVGNLLITGTTAKGDVILKHAERFTFEAAYPNGKDCDDSPALTYSTSVGGSDISR